MARGTQLRRLVDMLKAETGATTLVSVGGDMQPAYVQALQRTQELLYDDYDWPFLQIRPYKTLQAGQRFYDFPEVALEQLETVVVYYNGLPHPLMRGIRAEDYAAYDSDAGERVDPPLRWDVVNTGTAAQIEIWPVPASNGMRLQVFGKKALGPLVDDDDRADLDDQLIVLTAAVTLLARQESKDAALFERMAAKRLASVRGRTKGGSTSVRMGLGDTSRDVSGRAVVVIGS